MLDRNENLWIGMDSGAIYQVDDFSYNIERIDAGPRVKYVSGLYNDDKYNWYFFDNYFRRTGNYSYQNNGYFLSIKQLERSARVTSARVFCHDYVVGLRNCVKNDCS